MTKSMPPWMGKETGKEEMAESGGTKAPLKPFGKDMGKKPAKRGGRKMGRGACR